MGDKLKEITDRLAVIQKEIDNTEFWGAKLTLLGEEQRNLFRQLSYYKTKE